MNSKVNDIEKEEGIPTGIPLRFGAFAYDILLIASIWMITLWGLIFINDGQAIYGPKIQVLLVAETVFFYVYCWLTNGQTLGMKVWRIKLVSQNGRPPSLKQLFIRAMAAPISLAFFGLGFLWFYIGKNKQTWHDRWSHTFIVKISKKETA